LEEFKDKMNEYDLKQAIEINFFTLDKLNDFITKKEPWQTVKDSEKQEETKKVLYIVAE
jgi:methionyl-tRNA synthetase